MNIINTLKFGSNRKSTEHFIFLVTCTMLFTGFTVFSIVRARIGVDFAHDGTVMPPPIGLLSGENVQNGAFSQYGPVSTWLNSLVLYVSGSHAVVSLRIFDVILLSVSALLVLLTTMRIYNKWGALFGIATWMGCAPHFTNTWTYLAWPSTQGMFVLIVSVTLFSLADSKYIGKQKKVYFHFASGAVFGLLLFVRWHLFLVTLPIFIFCFIFDQKSIHKGFLSSSIYSLKRTKFFTLGVITSLFGVVLYLHQIDALVPFIDQAIVAPAKYYPAIGGAPWITFADYLIRYGAIFCLAISIPYLCTLLKLGDLSVKSIRVSRTAWQLDYSIAAIVIGLVVLELSYIYQDINLRMAPMYGVVLASFILILINENAQLSNKNASARTRNNRTRGMVELISLACFVQIYPTIDQRHVFWASIWAFAVVFGKLGTKRNLGITSIFLSVTTWIIVSLANDWKEARATQLYKVEGSNIYNDIYVSSEQLRLINNVDSFMTDPRLGSKFLIKCFDGVYSVWDGSYRSIDRFWGDWSWQWSVDENSRVREESFSKDPDVVFCGSLQESKSWAEKFGYLVKYENESLHYLVK